MSLTALDGHRQADCFPRVSGDEPAVAEVPWIASEFSPRERG